MKGETHKVSRAWRALIDEINRGNRPWELVQELRRLDGDGAGESMDCPCCGKPMRPPRDAKKLGTAEEFETFFQLGEHLEGSKLLARADDWRSGQLPYLKPITRTSGC